MKQILKFSLYRVETLTIKIILKILNSFLWARGNPIRFLRSFALSGIMDGISEEYGVFGGRLRTYGVDTYYGPLRVYNG